MAISQTLLGPTTQPLDLVRGGQLAPWCRLGVSRAQVVGVQSSAIAADGSSLAFYAADTPRFTGSAQRLLTEGPRTNSIRNPRGEGAVPGTPGTAPTNWALAGTGGVNFNIVGTGTENNLPYVDIRISGTSTTGNSPLIRADQVYPVAAQAQVWTHSMYVRLIAGTLNGITNFRMYVTEWTSGGAYLGQSASSFTLTSGPLSGARLFHTGTLTPPTTGLAGSQFDFVVSVGVPIDCTFRVASPQLELGAFASSPILPPVGTPGASTRGVDIVTTPLTSLGVTNTGKSTILWRGSLSQFVNNTRILSLTNAGGGVAFGAKVESVDFGFGIVNLLRFQNSGSVGGDWGPSLNTPIRIGLSVNPEEGRVDYEVRGDVIAGSKLRVNDSWASLTTLRLGSDWAGGNPMWGSTSNLRVYPNLAVTPENLSQLIMELPV